MYQSPADHVEQTLSGEPGALQAYRDYIGGFNAVIREYERECMDADSADMRNGRFHRRSITSEEYLRASESTKDKGAARYEYACLKGRR